MFLLSFVNVDSAARYENALVDIIAEARRCGFESVITNCEDGERVATYSPIGGVSFEEPAWRREYEHQRATLAPSVDDERGYPGVDSLGFSDVSTVSEYGLTQRLPFSVRVF